MRTLLLADDSVTVQRVIALTFADQQISVVTVADGQQAMERMAAQRPDIVLAGTTLPQVSGYDLARFMRSKPELKDVPVLLLTGAFETVDEARLAASGANGFIEKPVEPNHVIGRVKELLGLKSEAKPAAAGRLITPADGPAEKKLPKPTLPRAVTSMRGTPSKWEQLRDQTGLEPNTRSVEDASTRSEDYLDTLDAAFDSLDQQLSGRAASAKPSRNPSGPLGQSSGAPDPRSPGRRPQNGASAPGNPVFEVDDEWFGGNESQARADAKAGRRQIQDDLRDPDLQAPAAEAPPNPIFEVDDEWFAEDNKARAAKQDEQRVLAAEMGIHDVDLPPVEPVPNAPAPASDLDFDFGIDDLRKLQEPEPAEPPAFVEPKKAHVELPKRVVAPPPAIVAPPPAVVELPKAVVELPKAPVEPVAPSAFDALDALLTPAPKAPQAPKAPEAPQATQAPEALSSVMPTSPIIPLPTIPLPKFAPVAPAAPGFSREVADDFAQLLAFEQGEHPEPPMPPPPEIRVVAPEITEEILAQLAARVADRLNAGLFGEQLKNAVTETVRTTVREVASEASERIVREVANEASGRIARDVAAEASERIAREVASEASERIVREVASEASGRIAHDVAAEASERIVREVALEASVRIAREIAAEASERIVREVAADASDRIARDVAFEATERIVREVASEASTRIVPGVAAEASERIIRDVAAEASERIIRDVAADSSTRIVRDVVSETSERLVRDEIDRIKNKSR